MTILTKQFHPRHAAHAHHPETAAHRRNIGGWERGARLFLGAVATGAAFTAGGVWLRVLLGLVGVGGLATSVTGYCPVNRAIGHDSSRHPNWL